MRHALHTLALCVAPILPFSADWLFERLGFEESVHLESWPEVLPAVSEREELDRLYDSVEMVRHIVRLVYALRTDNEVPLQQPLSLITLDEALRESLLPGQHVIHVIFFWLSLIHI